MQLLASKTYDSFVFFNIESFPINIKTLTVNMFVGTFKYNYAPFSITVLKIISKVGFSLFCYNKTCVVHKKGKFNRTVKGRVSK